MAQNNDNNMNYSNNSENTEQVEKVTGDLNIMFWNSRSFLNKIEDISKLMTGLEILVVVETWLNEKIEDNKCCLQGYHLLRKDRKNSRGSGILFLISKKLSFEIVSNLIVPNNNDMENLAVKITNVKKPFNIIAIYKPPDVLLAHEDWDMVIENFVQSEDTIMMGDFNAHNQAWNCVDNRVNGSRLSNSINKNDIIIHNTNTKTRVDFNTGDKSNIDLILTNNDLAQYVDV